MTDWRSTWNDVARGQPLAPALERRVRAQGRRMLWVTVAQSLASLIGLVLVGQVAVNHPDRFHVAWGIGVGMLVAGTWVFLVINRLGVWAPYAETTEGFLAVMTERCRRRLRLARVVSALAALNLVFTAWLAWWGFRIRPGAPLHPADTASYVAAVVILAGVIGWAAWLRRRTQEELSQLKDVTGTIP